MTVDELPSTPIERSTIRQQWCRRGVWLCLAIQFLLACDTGRQLTPTHDEYWHLPLGLLIWKTARFDYDVINPPLFRLWASLPLVLGGAKLDLDVPFTSGGTTGDLFWTSNPEYRMLWYALGRAMVALTNVGTGWLMYLWGRRWFGDFVGLAAAMLWCCCPTVVANGSVVTHDAAAAFGFVSTLYALVCWCENPSPRRAAILGVCLGVAQLLKVTCVLLFPLTIIGWLLLWSVPKGIARERYDWRRWGIEWLLILGLAILVINAGYLGQQSCQTLESMNFGSQRFQSLKLTSWFRSWPIPLPRCYFQAFDRVAQDLQNQHPVFLDGSWSLNGFRMYYLKALAYKLPLGVWMMFLLSSVSYLSIRPLALPKPTVESDSINSSPAVPATRDPQSKGWRRPLFIIIPFLMLIVPASFGGNQIGIRYIFPVFPLFYLFAAQAANWLELPQWRWRQWLVSAALVSLPFSLRYHPHHLAYFNEWTGGPDAGKRLLVDSNLDWGQDLHGLADYLRDAKIEKIGLAYFGTVHPHSLGIQYALPPIRHPEPGDYAISANFEAGRPFVIRSPTPDGKPPTPTKEQPIPLSEPYVADFDDFGYFRYFQPRANIGHSIYLYHLTVEDVAAFNLALRRARGY